MRMGRKRPWLPAEGTDLVAFSKEGKVAPQVTDEDALQIITKRSQREQYVKNKGCHITTPRPLRSRTGHPHPSCKQDTFSSLEKATVGHLSGTDGAERYRCMRRHHIRDFGKHPQGRFSVSRVAQSVASRPPPYGWLGRTG